MRFVEKSVLLQTLDQVWKEHLLALDHLRQGIGLRAYGQRDPLNEYKSEAFALFNSMLDDLKQRVTASVAGLQLQAEPPQPPVLPAMMWENHPEAALESPAFSMVASEPVGVMTLPERPETVVTEDPATWGNTPRNAACPCGSGKKYKHCHGRMV
jgi:preprotein translocase subunit SecA